tara:strand:+ start:1618 stop:2892 length:1275 start_codon:yes stop_codon:yes gene_type:complete
MYNYRLLQLFIIFIISIFLNGNAFALYKPKMMITEFDDPKNWDNKFSPGRAISNLLENELKKRNNFQIIPSGQIQNMGQPKILEPQIMGKPLPKMPKESKKNQKLKNMKDMENQSSMNMFLDEPSYQAAKNSQHQRSIEIDPAIHYYGGDPVFNLVQIQSQNNETIEKQDRLRDESMNIVNDPIPWPANMAEAPLKASLYKIIGQIIKFDARTLDASIKNSEKRDALGPENAELEIKIQLVQNKTGRVVKGKIFKAFSNSGKRPFSEDIDFASNEIFNQKTSSMGLALSSITKEIIKFVNDSISSSFLEGEVISTNKDYVLINIGRQNGVKVGDRFRVYSLGLGLADPFTDADLGDIYVKMGVIRISETMLGFSKAMITTGDELFQGNLVKSFKTIRNSNNEFVSDVAKDEIPWWELKKIKSSQ